jgi:prophage maintenance system killer protein
MIISVGYRVKSKRGIIFRKWANNVLKDYLVKGYAINDKRLEKLNKVIDIQNRMLASALDIDTKSLENVINKYTTALDLLDDYDHQKIIKPTGDVRYKQLRYQDVRKLIDSMKFGAESNLFGVEKENGKLNGILEAVYQNVFGEELYKTIEDKAAHLLYFIVKDHPFTDGCKRIAATTFLEFLNINNKLVKNGKLVISNNTLVAITLLCAESKPDEMETIINVIMHLLKGDIYE